MTSRAGDAIQTCGSLAGRPSNAHNCGVFLNLRWNVTTVAAPRCRSKRIPSLLARMMRRKKPGKYLDGTECTPGAEA